MRQSFFSTVTLFFVVLISAPAFAQDIPLTLKIVNNKSEPVGFASFSVISLSDSTIIYRKVADSSGKAVINIRKPGQYIVKISAINYQPVEKGISITNTKNNFQFSAEPLPKTLAGVVVTSQKPLMRQEDDKTIVDPENLVASSTNGYEVIEKTPGLFIDQDGNIYISSLSPAAVQINGREMKMSAADISTMLKSLPPNAIQKIEIVRTPSAKYDASGGGGVVNVVLKKGFKIGMTGSVNAGLLQGTYGNQFIGLSLNNNNGKTSSYINLNYNHRNSYERTITDRLFASDSMLRQQAITKYTGGTYFTSYGIASSLSKKWDVDFAGSFSYLPFDNGTENKNAIDKISNGQLISNTHNYVNYAGNMLRFSNGINFKLKIDSTGSEWSNDFYYSYDRTRATQRYNTIFTYPGMNSSSGNGSPDNDRNYFTYTSDLKKKYPNKLTIEAGLKVSLLDFKSNASYFKQGAGGDVKDPNRTNKFNYDENINATYLQASKTFGKDIILKTGLRVENTNMKGKQIIPSDTTFSIHRTDLFPYVYLSKNIMKIAGYNLRGYLVYRRTISRPVYEQLNPFSRYVDQYLSEQGNPSLRPQFTSNYEANISVDEKPILAIGINDTKDIFTNVVYQANNSRSQAYRTYDNLGKNKEWYFRALGALPPGKKYFMVAGVQYNHNFYQGLYENQPLSFKKGTVTFFTFQSLKLDKQSQITVHGFMRLKGQQQFYELGSFGSLNASINRKFFKEKLILTLSMSDIFASNKFDFSIAQGSVNATGYRQSDSRRIGINLRYNFGIRKKEETNSMFDIAPDRN